MSLINSTNFSTLTALTADKTFYNLFSGVSYYYPENRFYNKPGYDIILPATTLTSYCYASMFSGCTSLTVAPELLATALVYKCYNSMFYGCTNLSSVTCLATDIPDENCTEDWLTNVALTGTFTKAPNTIWRNTPEGIPIRWTVQDYQG